MLNNKVKNAVKNAVKKFIPKGVNVEATKAVVNAALAFATIMTVKKTKNPAAQVLGFYFFLACTKKARNHTYNAVKLSKVKNSAEDAE